MEIHGLLTVADVNLFDDLHSIVSELSGLTFDEANSTITPFTYRFNNLKIVNSLLFGAFFPSIEQLTFFVVCNNLLLLLNLGLLTGDGLNLLLHLFLSLIKIFECLGNTHELFTLFSFFIQKSVFFIVNPVQVLGHRVEFSCHLLFPELKLTDSFLLLFDFHVFNLIFNLKFM